MGAPRTAPGAHRRAALGLAAALLLGACGSTDDTPQKEPEEQMQARPSMEEVLDRYDAMRRAMVDALDTELGGITWYPDPESGISGASCSEPGAPTDAQDVQLVSLYADGTYDPAQWQRSIQIVQDVGRAYGFTEVGTVVDQPDDLEVYGEDEYGARYRFGMAVNSVLALRTGCHVWDEAPGPDYERPAPLG